MPRIDNGTGRDISKWNGTLEKALLARKDMLNVCKTNNDLIDVLMDCEKDGLSAEGTAYTDRLIATISSNPNFRKNFQNVYNVLLKGTGNGVLKCSAKKPAKKGLKESEAQAYLDKLKDFERVAQRNSFKVEYDPSLVLEVKDNTGASHTITFSEDDAFVKLDGKTLPFAIPYFEDESIIEECSFFEGAGYQVLLTFGRYFLDDIFVLKTRVSEKVSKRGLKESVPDFSGCSHFYRLGDVIELAQTNPAAFGERSAFLPEVEGAGDLLNEPGYADAFVECPDGEDIAPNTIQVWYLDDILDTTGATAKFVLPDDTYGFFCDRCALLSFWDYLTILYEEVGEDLSLESYGWNSVNADTFDPRMNRDVVNSNSVSVKSGVQEYTKYPDGGISTPDYPKTIKVGRHTVDFEIVNDGIENIVVDGELATWDLDNSDEETNIAYTDDNAVILFFGRHSLLDSVVVLNESLTAVLRNKITAHYD